jgi:hypothetical protein
MISIEKLKEFEMYKGYYDGFYWKKIKNNTKINSGQDWIIIENLVQDFKIIFDGLAADDFARKKEVELKQNFDSIETIQYFKILIAKL